MYNEGHDSSQQCLKCCNLNVREINIEKVAKGSSLKGSTLLVFSCSNCLEMVQDANLKPVWAENEILPLSDISLGFWLGDNRQ